MLGNTLIKWLHRALTAVLLVLVVGYAAYQHYSNGASDDSLYSRRQINDNTWLYITQYEGGGATVSDVYRYYLDGRLDDEPLKHLAGRRLFLVADVGDAKVSGHDDLVDFNITGCVCSFTNSDLFTLATWPSFPLLI